VKESLPNLVGEHPAKVIGEGGTTGNGRAGDYNTFIAVVARVDQWKGEAGTGTRNEAKG